MIRMVLEGDKNWAKAAKGGQEVPVLCPEEWEKTGGHGQRIRGDSIVAGV